MVSLEVSKKNHEKLKFIRDEKGYRSFNEVLDKLLPDGVVGGMDFEKEVPAFVLINRSESWSRVQVTWDELRNASIGDSWVNGDSATVIFCDDFGCVVRFIDEEFGSPSLNYFHFL